MEGMDFCWKSMERGGSGGRPMVGVRVGEDGV